MQIGDIWRWKKNSAEHPDDSDYNYFVVLNTDWGIHVMYLIDGKHTVYTADTYTVHKNHLEFVA